MGKKFKILSIDGGGIRGVFPAQYIACLEQRLGETEGQSTRICDHFDLISGTSTGGILALGLALGIPASELKDLYVENRKVIFGWPNNKILRRKYSRKNLESLIREKFKSAMDDLEHEPLLLDAKTRLCITGYDIENACPKVFKTPHKVEYKIDLYRPAYQVALATGAAPTFFSPFKGKYKTFNSADIVNFPLTVDGGVFSNNPTLIAIMEVHKGLGIDLANIEVVSIGTGTETYTESDSKTIFKIPIRRSWGAFYWMYKTRILNLMFQAQSQHIDDMCNIFSKGTGDSDERVFPYHRIQTNLDQNLKIAMDSSDLRKLEALINRATNEFQISGNKIEQLITNNQRWGGFPS